jgi:hypothetical protein
MDDRQRIVSQLIYLLHKILCSHSSYYENLRRALLAVGTRLHGAIALTQITATEKTNHTLVFWVLTSGSFVGKDYIQNYYYYYYIIIIIIIIIALELLVQS